MKKLYINRAGEIIESTNDSDIVSGRGMNMKYLRRMVDSVKPNEINYIDVEASGRTTEALRMSFGKIASETGKTIKTITHGNLLGFVVCDPKAKFI